jgi:5-methylcytosine-specific restriction endonuclease McrA
MPKQAVRRPPNHTAVCNVWRNTYGDTFNGVCKLCKQRHISFDKRSGIDGWEVAHVIPIKYGGDNDITNLRPLCRPCNRAMSSKSFKDYIAKNHSSRMDELIKAFNLH